MAEYVKVDDFVDIAKECGGDPKVILREYPEKFTSFSSLKNRLGRLRRKGLLPLDSGNSVSSGEILKGTSTLYDGQGNIKQQWVKSDTDKEQLLGAFKDAVQGILDRSDFQYKKVKKPKSVESDLMTIYPIGDAHVGMLAHAAETGQDHDLAISRERHINAIRLAVKTAPESEQAFIIDVGDWYHADNGNNRTPRGGNALDVDGRFHKVIDTGFEIATEMIKAALEKHQTVHWRSAEGNHNEHLAIMLSYYLRAYFKDEDRVIVHCSPSMFFYHKFGKNLIGITHGHTSKPANLPGVMATDVPKLWGDTEYRYWYLGHIHHDVVKEMPGCKLETFRTLAGKDAWHASMGYRSGQDLKTITLHKDYGEVSRNTFNVALIDQ